MKKVTIALMGLICLFCLMALIFFGPEGQRTQNALILGEALAQILFLVGCGLVGAEKVVSIAVKALSRDK